MFGGAVAYYSAVACTRRTRWLSKLMGDTDDAAYRVAIGSWQKLL